MARGIRRQLSMLALAGAMLFAWRPVCAQTTGDVGLTSSVKNRSTGTISDADLRTAAASMDEGRAALKRNSPREAIRLFTKVLALPAETLRQMGVQ